MTCCARASGDSSLLSPVAACRETIGAEVVYAVEQEMARQLADVVFRRTGLGTLGHPGEPALERCAAIMATRLGWSAAERAGQLRSDPSLFFRSRRREPMACDPLRVLVLAPTPFFGDRGCHVRIYEEVRGLMARGIEAHVVTYPTGRDPRGLAITRGAFPGSVSRPEPWDPRGGRPLLDLAVLDALPTSRAQLPAAPGPRAPARGDSR